jgi:hypothetical protein
MKTEHEDTSGNPATPLLAQHATPPIAIARSKAAVIYWCPNEASQANDPVPWA